MDIVNDNDNPTTHFVPTEEEAKNFTVVPPYLALGASLLVVNQQSGEFGRVYLSFPRIREDISLLTAIHEVIIPALEQQGARLPTEEEMKDYYASIAQDMANEAMRQFLSTRDVVNAQEANEAGLRALRTYQGNPKGDA